MIPFQHMPNFCLHTWYKCLIQDKNQFYILHMNFCLNLCMRYNFHQCKSTWSIVLKTIQNRFHMMCRLTFNCILLMPNKLIKLRLRLFQSNNSSICQDLIHHKWRKSHCTWLCISSYQMTKYNLFHILCMKLLMCIDHRNQSKVHTFYLIHSIRPHIQYMKKCLLISISYILLCMEDSFSCRMSRSSLIHKDHIFQDLKNIKYNCRLCNQHKSHFSQRIHPHIPCIFQITHIEYNNLYCTWLQHTS